MAESDADDAAAPTTMLSATQPAESVADAPSPPRANARPPAAAAPAGRDDLVTRLLPSVFAIGGATGFGTAVLIDDEKLLTNCHVVSRNAGAGAQIFAVNAATGQRLPVTRVAYMNFRGEDACLAIVPGLTGRAVELGDAYELSVGSHVHNLGFPQARLTASDGEVTGIVALNGQNFIQSTNYCAPGISGGPLVDDHARLVGLTTGGPRDRSRCYSLTINTARRVLYEPSIPVEDMPTDYLSNLVRH